MRSAAQQLADSKSIIKSICGIVQEAQHRAVAFARESYASSADCYVLLHDATKQLCEAVSEHYGETEKSKRWSPALPELLLSHPEKCEEILAMLERKQFEEISYFHFAGI